MYIAPTEMMARACSLMRYLDVEAGPRFYGAL